MDLLADPLADPLATRRTRKTEGWRRKCAEPETQSPACDEWPPETPSRGEQVVVRPSHRPKAWHQRWQQMLKQTAKKTASQGGIRSQYLRLPTRAVPQASSPRQSAQDGTECGHELHEPGICCRGHARRRRRPARWLMRALAGIHAASSNVRLAA